MLFNFTISTAVAYVPKMGHAIPVCRITEQARAPLFPTIDTTLQGLVSVTSGFSKNGETWFRLVIAPLCELRA